MTLNEVAAAAGVTKMAVSKKKLPHTVNSDGSFFFDPENAEVNAYITRSTRNREVAHRPKQTTPIPKKEPRPEKKIPIYAAAPPREPKLDFSDDEDYKNMVLKNRKLELEIGKARGALIPQDLVLRWIKHLFDADTNALKVLPDRIGSSLAMLARGAEDESTAGAVVRNFLTEELTRVIGGIKRVQKDFNKSLEPSVFDRAEKEEEQEAV
jgi:hypothetical protein